MGALLAPALLASAGSLADPVPLKEDSDVDAEAPGVIVLRPDAEDASEPECRTTTLAEIGSDVDPATGAPRVRFWFAGVAEDAPVTVCTLTLGETRLTYVDLGEDVPRLEASETPMPRPTYRVRTYSCAIEECIHEPDGAWPVPREGSRDTSAAVA